MAHLCRPSLLYLLQYCFKPHELQSLMSFMSLLFVSFLKSHVTFATTDNYDDWCADISEMKNRSIIQAGLLHVTEFVLARPGWLTLLSTTGSSACLPQTIDLGTTFHGICNALADFLTLAVFHGDSQIIEASIPTFVQIQRDKAEPDYTSKHSYKLFELEDMVLFSLI